MAFGIWTWGLAISMKLKGLGFRALQLRLALYEFYRLLPYFFQSFWNVQGLIAGFLHVSYRA